MTDFLNALRMRRHLKSLFDTQVPPELNTSSPLNPPNMGALSLRKPVVSPDLNAYKQYLESEPTRESFKGGKTNNILAAIAGFGEGMNKGPGAAYATSKGIIDQPYEDALKRYNSKGGRLKERAELEYRGMTDDQKLANQDAEYQLKLKKEAREELENNANIKLKGTQLDLAIKRMESEGKRLERNTKDGKLYVVDITTGASKELGQFAQSASEKLGDEKNLFSYKNTIENAHDVKMEGLRQGNRISLEGIKNANSKDLAALRDKFTKGNIELKKDIDSMTPAAQKAAFELAYSQAVTDLGMDEKEIAKNPTKLSDAIRERLQNVRKRSGSKGMLDTSAVQTNYPVVTPTTEGEVGPLRMEAIAEIKKTYPNNPELLTNEDAIREAIEQLKKGIK